MAQKPPQPKNKPLKIVQGHATQSRSWPKSAKIVVLLLTISIVVIGCIATAAIVLAVTYATSLERITGEDPWNQSQMLNVSVFPFRNYQDPLYLNDTYSFTGCGIQSEQPILNKIINGYEANPHSWPWMVVLGYFGMVNQTFVCGGSLLNSRWVLTAAHCVADDILPEFGQNNPNYTLTSMIRVFTGIHNITSDRRPYNTYQAEKIVRHPLYNSKYYTNDIALIKLSRDVPKSNTVGYLCIDPLAQIDVGELVYAAGWGSTNPDYDKQNSPRILLQVTFRVLDHFMCRAETGFRESKQFCAGKPSSNPTYVKDTCFGDSGGPIMVKRNNWAVVGVVSYGNAACDGNGIYTKVNAYYDWIMDNVFLK